MRRTNPERRITPPDIKYNNVYVQTFVHHIMKNGKKSVALRLVYDALDIVQQKSGKYPIEVMEAALKNVGPLMEVRPRRVGGATYQVPMEVASDRRVALAIRWIIASSRSRSGHTFSEKFAGEILDAASGQGTAVRKREETHKMAEANRAFSHYRV
ncbi:MAG: 30S ribosomal protein S7 [Chloroflexi bacterium HGW-Chloroflexi-10]|jgi:small subunit ribosomal protein S7|nr:MAG: 30S ribosomal protein S7 [Chloroflexi bacterium HGW-Chloroflexi-10]